MIQLIKVDDHIWVCNLAGKKSRKLDSDSLKEAFSKLEKWSSENRLKVYLSCDSDIRFSDLLRYVYCLEETFPDATLCFPNEELSSFLNATKPNDLSDILAAEISRFQVFRIRIATESGGSFTLNCYSIDVGSGGFVGEESYVEVISLNDVIEMLEDVFEAISSMGITYGRTFNNSFQLEEYKKLLIDEIQALPKHCNLKRSNGLIHTGITLNSVLGVFNRH